MPLLGVTATFIAISGGCSVASFFDPSKSAVWMREQSTSMPILTKIDVIEREAVQADLYSAPTPQDLIPTPFSYRLGPSDVLRVEVHDLVRPGEVWTNTLEINQSGYIRLPQIGDLLVAGYTEQEVQDAIAARISSYVLNPTVNVIAEAQRGLQYTVYGMSGGGDANRSGLYSLRQSDFRLIQALAVAGGVPFGTRYIYVHRDVPLVPRPFDNPPPMTPPANPANPAPTTNEMIDVEDLIDQLESSAPRPATTAPTTAPIFPGMVADEPPIDVDDLEPVRISDRPISSGAIPRPAPVADDAVSHDSYIFDVQQNRWVKVDRPEATKTSAPRVPANTRTRGTMAEPPPTADDGNNLYLTRRIKIDYDQLAAGDPTLNIIIRPGDYIFIETPQVGNVYIEGEVARPGVYQIPVTKGSKLTLSRLISAAGGFTAIAIPERVDLVRMVGEDREATIMVDLGAIRHRTEPDVYIKPNDHVIVGTNFWAYPLAVIRNGFRATYGFGFLLDRNFGNDVFGAPPTNQFGE